MEEVLKLTLAGWVREAGGEFGEVEMGDDDRLIIVLASALVRSLEGSEGAGVELL